MQGGDCSNAVREGVRGPFGACSGTVRGPLGKRSGTGWRPSGDLQVYARDAQFFGFADVQLLGLSLRYLFGCDRHSHLSNPFEEHLRFCFCCVFVVTRSTAHVSNAK